MTVDDPEMLEDRDVLVVRADERRQARLRAWLDGYDGPRPLYRIELFLRPDRYTATAMNMSEALVRLRLQLEPDGWLIAVRGARRDTPASGMSTDLTGATTINVPPPDRGTTADDVVDTLADAPVEHVGTVAEQRAWVQVRFAAPRKDHPR